MQTIKFNTGHLMKLSHDITLCLGEKLKHNIV